MFKITTLLKLPEGCPNHVAIGVPDVAALERVAAKLRAHRIPHAEWHEPDGDMGFTAIATAPLNGEERKVLANYRLLRHGGTGRLPAPGVMAGAATRSPFVQA